MGTRYPIITAGAPLDLSGECCALAIMAKAPVPGAVKTRLVPPLSLDEAARLSACFIGDIAANIGALARDHGIHGYAAYTPVGLEAAFDGLLPEGFRLLAQRGKDLGERLRHAVADLLAIGYQSVCLVNSDSPTLPQVLLRRAVAALRRSGERVVLGAAADGGYYLIGLKTRCPRLFQGIDWSTERVLCQTMERAAEIGLPVETLPVWGDVDDAAALAALCRELYDGTPPSYDGTLAAFAAPQTRLHLATLVERAHGRLPWLE